MSDKFVKDRAHNRYPAYCCDDIDVRVGALEAAVAALVAGTIPDGSVTLAKLADDARTYRKDLNSGALFAEWIGTESDLSDHMRDHDYEMLPNVKYILTDETAPAHITDDDLLVGALITVGVDDSQEKSFQIGETCSNFTKSENFATFYKYNESYQMAGTWRCIGRCGHLDGVEGESSSTTFYLFQRVE